jgi:hypothetical protein
MLSVLNKKIFKLIDTYFNNIDEKKLINGMFSIYYDGLCIEFKIDDDTYNELSIGVYDLNKCHYSGTNNLERLELLVKNINIKYLYLEDPRIASNREAKVFNKMWRI